jgi:hypothetical protein
MLVYFSSYARSQKQDFPNELQIQLKIDILCVYFKLKLLATCPF